MALSIKHSKADILTEEFVVSNLIHQVLSKQLESSRLSKEIKTTLQKLRESTSSSELQNNYQNLENNSEMKRLILT